MLLSKKTKSTTDATKWINLKNVMLHKINTTHYKVYFHFYEVLELAEKNYGDMNQNTNGLWVVRLTEKAWVNLLE